MQDKLEILKQQLEEARQAATAVQTEKSQLEARLMQTEQEKQSVKEQLSQLEQEKQTIKKDLEESLQEAGAAREELAAVRQAQVEAYMKRKPFPKRQGTVELKDAILRFIMGEMI